jgi:hypothetical protein
MNLFSGNCRACQHPEWSRNNRLQNMNIEVHRAGRTFYPHYTVLLNIPSRQLEGFFNLQEWQAIAAAKFFDLPEVANRPLSDFRQSTSNQQSASDPGLSGTDLDNLMNRHTPVVS